MIRFGSVCSGIEAASVAWNSLGWEPQFLSETACFPRAVLKHHYPDVPLHGDFTTIGEKDYGAINILVGGPPCQSFSIAGLRGGMADDRGNLALQYLKLAARLRPDWILFENVVGILSSGGGRDFGSLLGGMVELGYGFAYRVLNAEYFGVPQRRRRVYVVGSLAGWQRAAAVLFERDSFEGNFGESRKKKNRYSAGTSRGAAEHHRIKQPYRVANCLTNRMHKGVNSTLDEGQTPILSFHPMQDPINSDKVFHAIGGRGQATVAVALAENQRGEINLSESAQALAGRGGKPGQGYAATFDGVRVRKLTPVECERLQGFPDDYTRVPYRGKAADDCPDAPRYRAIGNSFAVPVVRWIGERINEVNEL